MYLRLTDQELCLRHICYKYIFLSFCEFFFVTFQLMKTSFKKLETISALGVENKFAKKYKDAIFEQYK